MAPVIGPFGHIERALGVPEILRPENRLSSAAVKLLAAASVSPSKRTFGRDATPEVEDARLVVMDVTRALEAGELDPLLGGYGDRNAHEVADRLANRMGEAHSGTMVQSLTRKLVELVLKYVRAHPFGEG